MEEALKILKACVEDIEKAIPAVSADAVKNYKSYKILRERTLTAQMQIKLIRAKALENFNKIYYATHPRKAKSNA